MSIALSKRPNGSEDMTPAVRKSCAIRLTVRHWLSRERSFQLNPCLNLEPLGSDFDSQIDWRNDLVEFIFKLPHDYPDTPQEVFRKVQKLIQGGNILGMRTTFTGELEVTTDKHELKRKIHARNLKKFHSREFNLLGNSLNWARRAGVCYFEFEVDCGGKLIVMVNENDAEYQGAGLDPVNFLKVMVLPVRIWLRFQYWATLYRRKNLNQVSIPILANTLYRRSKPTASVTWNSGDLLTGIIASLFKHRHQDITSCRGQTKGKKQAESQSEDQHGNIASPEAEREIPILNPNSLSDGHTPRSKNAQKKARQRRRDQTRNREEKAATHSKQQEKFEFPLMATGSVNENSLPPSLHSPSSTGSFPPFMSTPGTSDPATTYPPSSLWVPVSNESSIDIQTHFSFCKEFVDLELFSEDEKQVIQTAGIRGKERVESRDRDRDRESQQHLFHVVGMETPKEQTSPETYLSSLMDNDSVVVSAVNPSTRSMTSFTPPSPSSTHHETITQTPSRNRSSSLNSTCTKMKDDVLEDPFHTEWTALSCPNLAANSQSFPGPVASALIYILRSIPMNQGMTEDSNRYQALTKPPDGSFFIDLMYHPLTCRQSGCEKVCNLYDGSTVICPCCGPYSKTRYCCKNHLFLDLQSHWGSGKLTFDRYCVSDSIPLDVREGIPLLINIHGWNTPQRHRQAVWFNNSHNTGDYFVFDYSDPEPMGRASPNAQQRMSVLPLYLIKFDDPEERDRFRRFLAISLFAPVTNPKLVEYFFRLVRDKMKRLRLWNRYNAALVQNQVFRETGLDFPSHIVGPKHACYAEWNGNNPNHCSHAPCSNERLQSLLGDQRTRVFHRLECERLENLHWILRVNRTTHPTVSKAQDRMRGEGWHDVLPEHRRLFRRGEGFEGAGSGPMEVEGMNC